MSSKDLALIFMTSIIGLVFVLFKIITKVLFEWYVLHIILVAGITTIIIKFIFACLS